MLFNRLPAIFAVAVLVTTLSSVVSSVRAAVPNDGKLDFTVLRDGDPIGRHVLSFKQGSEGLVVEIETKIEVKVLFITAYHFEHQGREIWRDGKLTVLVSSTNDDGTEHTLAVKASGAELQVEGDGEMSKAALEIIPASLWHEGILAGGAILNTLQGRQMNVKVTDAGTEEIDVVGQTVAAHHFVIEGDLQREVWFDDKQVLVKVRFKGKDGSSIEYVRR
jgi:hypothetical protein